MQHTSGLPSSAHSSAPSHNRRCHPLVGGPDHPTPARPRAVLWTAEGDIFAAKLDPGALLHGAYLDGSGYDAAGARALGPSSRSRAVSACPFINSASAIAAMVGAICRSPSAVTV